MANDEEQTQQQQQEESKPRENVTGLPSPQHIRPRIQRKPKSPKSGATPKQDDGNKNGGSVAVEVEIEETRKRMDSWMGLGGNKAGGKQHGAKTAKGRFGRENGGSANSSDKQKESVVVVDNGKTAVGSAPSPTSGVGSKNTVVVSHPKQNKQQQQQSQQPVSILKNPKYSSSKTTAVIVGSPTPASTTKAGVVSDSSNDVMTVGRMPVKQSNNGKSKAPVICKDFVVERDPVISAARRKSFRRDIKSKGNNANDSTKQQQQQQQASAAAGVAHHASIEGYVPSGARAASKFGGNDGVTKKSDAGKTADAENDDKSSNGEDPLVIDSLEELMRAAGESMPPNPNKITDDTKMVEANISFSVMTKDQYNDELPVMQQEQEEERKQQLEVFMGKHDIFEDDDDESSEGALEGDGNAVGDDDEDDDAVMELLLGSDIDTDDENDARVGKLPEVRAFTLLWNALTDWMTHDTVVWMKALRNYHDNDGDSKNATSMPSHNSNNSSMDTEWSPMVDRSDIGASRCAGVLAMIRLYLGQCMQELKYPLESRRRAEKRLNDIMRTFDYSRENPKLTASHWKAMACILLDAVLVETREADSASIRIPQSVANVGMTKEEFEYLSRKAVLIFETSD